MDKVILDLLKSMQNDIRNINNKVNDLSEGKNKLIQRQNELAYGQKHINSKVNELADGQNIIEKKLDAVGEQTAELTEFRSDK